MFSHSAQRAGCVSLRNHTLLTGSSFHTVTHTHASGSGSFASLANRFIHKSWHTHTHKHTQAHRAQAASQAAEPERVGQICSSFWQDMKRSEGSRDRGLRLGSVWVVLGVYKNRNGIILLVFRLSLDPLFKWRGTVWKHEDHTYRQLSSSCSSQRTLSFRWPLKRIQFYCADQAADHNDKMISLESCLLKAIVPLGAPLQFNLDYSPTRY